MLMMPCARSNALFLSTSATVRVISMGHLKAGFDDQALAIAVAVGIEMQSVRSWHARIPERVE